MNERDRDRAEEIREMLEQHVMQIGNETVYNYDVQYHAHIHLLTDVLIGVDRALEWEGISEETRDRVMWRSLNGEV